MNIVGGCESLSLTTRVNKYIITLVDCFSRYALAYLISDQSSETVINAAIRNEITIDDTPSRILTDQGKWFESAVSFIIFFVFVKFAHLDIDHSSTAFANVLTNRLIIFCVSYFLKHSSLTGTYS